MDAEQARHDLDDERRRLTGLEQDAPETAVEGEGAMDRDAGDHGRDTEQFLDEQALDVNAKRQIEQIDAALGRLDDGSWGRCVVCGRDIDDERLEARPEADRCREHQEELERTGR
jgi:RNA polymerase-binding transcription factor DksA